MPETDKLIKIDDDLEKAVQIAGRIYFEGGVFIYPTDTIYGFGANPFNEDAVRRISEIKERDSNKLYILLVGGLETLLKYVELKNEKQMDFLISVWPNPISVVLNLNSKTKTLLNLQSAAFRIPNNRFCQKLLSVIKMPLISTSVNRKNQTAMVETESMASEFISEVDALFYTEKKSFFDASTIIDLSGSELKLIREGKIKFDELAAKYEA
jgi:L-threonylcarbamoyladenylate synthase